MSAAGSPLLADELVALLQQAMSDGRFEGACTVYMDLGPALLHCSARIDADGDVIIAVAPWVAP